MRRAGVPANNHDAVLGFTRGVEKVNFRDRCNEIWLTADPCATKHRETERAVGCGWFDWFIQLFRQTWTGQAEILFRARQSGHQVALLPWDHQSKASIRIAEGFPGATLRRLELPAQGYKQDTIEAQTVRQIIVDGLIARGLPLTPEVKDQAIQDVNGDLIDALAMLLAGRDALGTDHSLIYAELNKHELLGEGWIYS